MSGGSGSDPVQRIAEAMCAVGHPGEVAEEMALNGSVWLRLAQAAIDALELREETGEGVYTHNWPPITTGYVPPVRRVPMRRLVSPWERAR